MAPLSISITGTGCTPSSAVTVLVWRDNTVGDATGFLPNIVENVNSDASGDWNATIPISVAYPGMWHVSPGCASPEHTFTVDTVAGFGMSITPTTFVLNATNAFMLSGNACAGATATWWIGANSFFALATGSVPVNPDGSWTASITADIPANSPQLGNGGTSLPVGADCVFPDGVHVQYTPETISLAPNVSSTTSSSTSTQPTTTASSSPVAAVQATPRFTG